METNDLKNTWKTMEAGIEPKTKEELNQSLTAITRKTMNKFVWLVSADVIACMGFLAFLIITAFNRQNDSLYLINNSILAVITLVSGIASVMIWDKLNNNKSGIPLKTWLEQRIQLLSGWLYGKYSKAYMVLLPILLVLINLSIHVYYENKLMVEVMKDEESLFGLAFGSLIGMAVAFYLVAKIRKYQVTNLEYLKKLYGQL